MKIKLDDIPEEGMSLDLIVEGKNLDALARGGAAPPAGAAHPAFDFSIVAPVKAHLDVMSADGGAPGKGMVVVKGQISASVAFTCSRCLKPFEQPLDADFSVFFVRGRAEGKEVELSGDDLEVNYLEGPDLETDDILLSQIALEAPMQPLCMPQCKGLCPRCGADINAGPCGCKIEEKTGSRFAVLKDLKLK